MTDGPPPGRTTLPPGRRSKGALEGPGAGTSTEAGPGTRQAGLLQLAEQGLAHPARAELERLHVELVPRG